METQYNNIGCNISLEGMEFLYYDESVKRACSYVDALVGRHLEYTFSELLEIEENAANMVDSADTDLKMMACYILNNIIHEYLGIKNLAEENKFHNYLIYFALAYHMNTHRIKVGKNRYKKKSINITNRLEAAGRKLNACACGHEPVALISPSLVDVVYVKIMCPHCGAKSMVLLNHENILGSHRTDFYSLKAAVDRCMKEWDVECSKTTEYKTLELLISEFFGIMGVTDRVSEYSQILHEYVNSVFDERYLNNLWIYQQEVAQKLYHDVVAMNIVNEYLWECSSNRDGDGLHPLLTAEYDEFCVVKIAEKVQ